MTVSSPFIVKGVAPDGLRALVYESLMARSADEPFTLYGLLAETIEVPPDRSWITFHIDPRARFSDGVPVTADDVVFTHALLRDKGPRYMRGHYEKVKRVEKLAERSVRFEFGATEDREIALIIGLMPILPRHANDPDTFERTSLEKTNRQRTIRRRRSRRAAHDDPAAQSAPLGASSSRAPRHA